VALYEVVLRYPERVEIRLSDRPLTVGQELELGGVTWAVVLEREASNPSASARFVCEPAQERASSSRAS
jgi:hypothetical protein